MEKAPPTKRPSYDAAFCVGTLRLASENRSAQAAARALNIRPGLLYQWQGLEACLWASAAFVLAAGALSLMLPSEARRHSRPDALARA